MQSHDELSVQRHRGLRGLLGYDKSKSVHIGIGPHGAAIPITRRFAGLREYEVLPVSGTEGEDAPDAFAIMAFDSEADFQAVLGSPEFQEAMEDSPKFVDRASSYVVGSIPVVASEGAVR